MRFRASRWRRPYAYLTVFVWIVGAVQLAAGTPWLYSLFLIVFALFHCRLSLQLESEGVEVITMDHPAVTSLGDLTFDSPFHLPITLHPSGSAEKVFVRVKNPCTLVDWPGHVSASSVCWHVCGHQCLCMCVRVAGYSRTLFTPYWR